MSRASRRPRASWTRGAFSMLGLSGPGLPIHLPDDVTSSAGWRRIGRGCEHSSSGPHPASRLRGPMWAKAPKGRIGSRRSTRGEHARGSTEPSESGASAAAEPTGVRDSRRGEQGRRVRHLARPEGRESSPGSLSKLPAPERRTAAPVAAASSRKWRNDAFAAPCAREVRIPRAGRAACAIHAWKERARVEFAGPSRSHSSGVSEASQIECGKSPSFARERLTVERQKEPLDVEIARSS